ncbi:SurA N-terminal domain-containing protein [candidate division FCPU426 bacterium]|nr:SurA N-terminal domain-containing protein [candidate division FCPU426 bacterium]
MKYIGHAAVLCCLVLTISGITGCGKKNEKTLAVVGGRKITTVDFNRALQNLPENYKILAESYKGKRKILENLVKKELLVIEAEKRDYSKDAEIKKRVEELVKRSKKEMDERIAMLADQRTSIERQVYENVLLSELNIHLKKEGLQGVEITPQEVSEYYQDYVRKLKILNPAAKVPKQETVAKQIKAILTEERLISNLEKAHSVEIKETMFKELYGDDTKDIVIDDAADK